MSLQTSLWHFVEYMYASYILNMPILPVKSTCTLRKLFERLAKVHRWHVYIVEKGKSTYLMEMDAYTF